VAKRKPIEYSAQFAPGVFRPVTEIETELEALDRGADAPPDRIDARPDVTGRPAVVRTNERTNVRRHTTSVVDERAEEPRRRIRHSFDIWEDQLLSLAEIQAQRFTTTRHKPKLGELVQEALDAYIEQYQTGESDRSSVRSNERTRRNT
jgi:hypothetical protein